MESLAPDLLASDAERERCVAQLRVHAADGRITVEELDDRSSRAYAARTVRQLAELMLDLPVTPVGRKPATLPAVGGPGVRAFTYQRDLPVGTDKAVREAVRHIAPALHRLSYELVDRSSEQLVFRRSHRPGWTYLGLLLPPFGLLALLHQVDEHLTIDFDSLPDGGTRLTVRGSAPRRVRKAFAELVT
jgi:hypothetical protein